jgi:hypothetical protein
MTSFGLGPAAQPVAYGKFPDVIGAFPLGEEVIDMLMLHIADDHDGDWSAPESDRQVDRVGAARSSSSWRNLIEG